jgi:hypothetical protein
MTACLEIAFGLLAGILMLLVIYRRAQQADECVWGGAHDWEVDHVVHDEIEQVKVYGCTRCGELKLGGIERIA